MSNQVISNDPIINLVNELTSSLKKHGIKDAQILWDGEDVDFSGSIENENGEIEELAS